MKITSIELNNVRGFRNLDINFSKRVNVFVGANNSGKSTLLNCILAMQQKEVLGPQDVSIGMNSGKVKIFYDGHHTGFRPHVKNLELNLIGKWVNIHKHGGTTDYRHISRQEPNNLIYPYLSRRKVDEYEELVDEKFVNSVTGTFKHLSLKIDRLTTYPANEEYINACKNILGFVVSSQTKGKGKQAVFQISPLKHIPLTSMGEGVPNIVGLITDLCVAKDRIFLIEEPENDIHPKALKSLLNLIVSKSTNNQFFISTHSNIVMKYLGGIEDSKLFHVSINREEILKNNTFISKATEISKNPEDRKKVLEDLGYDFLDFDLWKGWLFLEESSAEVIIRDHLIRWFCPKLQYKLRTFSAGSISQIVPKFEEFNKLFVFLHLQPTYKNKVWVIIDEGDSEKEIIDRLKRMYTPSGWDESHFDQFSEHDFENYYPNIFQDKVDRILKLPKNNKRDKQLIREEKRLLLNEVKNWIKNNESLAKAEFRESAKEVIKKLKRINKNMS